MREWVKIAALLLLSLILALVFYGFMFRDVESDYEPIGDPAFLKLTIAGEVVEHHQDDVLLSYFENTPILDLRNILQSIRRAAVDDRIKGIYLRPMAALMGWGKIAEIRNALLEFKTSGKPIYAFLDAASSREYYLAAVADTVVGVGSGVLFLGGYLSQPTFYKDLLDKVGIEADFVAHGEYKTAPNTYTRSSMSEEQREVINAILDQFYQNLVANLSESRGLPQAKIRELIDRGLFSLAAAREKALIDTLMYEAEFSAHLEKRFGEDLVTVDYRNYLHGDLPDLDVNPDGKIALIYGSGTIVMGGKNSNGLNDLITGAGMAADIRSAAEDESVKAIVLRIDSPGGSATASDIIWREVVAARAKKPVIASVSDVAASGGYYISMAADTIVAHPNSIVGSIGVFAGKFSTGKFFEKIGIATETLKRGRNADFFTSESRFSPEQRDILRGYIMETYNDFISKAGQGRGKTAEEIDRIARGRVWTGEQALGIGLVDVLGDFSEAIAIAKEKIGLSRDTLVPLEIYPHKRGLLERIRSGQLSLAEKQWEQTLNQLPLPLRKAVGAIPHFNPGEALYLAPVDFWNVSQAAF
ncbi:MAG TPA: signal peptide peptidase SppA [Calditrichia bacterium]|nr:signal peptide peptidase SppA [Calditrichia bacterium]